MTLHAYDSLGDSVDNLVINEEHNTANATARCIIADSGLFYTESVIVKRKSNNQPLTLGTDYEFYGFDPVRTFITGKETACSIVLKDDTISGILVLRYQAVGGTDAEKSALVEDLRRRIMGLENGTITWADILDKPLIYPPEPHQHDILTDLQNVSTLSVLANRIVEALTSSRVPVLSAVNVNAKIDRCFQLLGYVRKELNNIALNMLETNTYMVKLTGANFTPSGEQTFFTNWVLVSPVLRESKFITWDAANKKLLFTALGNYRIETIITAQLSSIVGNRNELAKLRIEDTINYVNGVASDSNYTSQQAANTNSLVTFRFINYVKITDLLLQNNRLQFAMATINSPYQPVALSATVVVTKI